MNWLPWLKGILKIKASQRDSLKITWVGPFGPQRKVLSLFQVKLNDAVLAQSEDSRFLLLEFDWLFSEFANQKYWYNCKKGFIWIIILIW